VSGPKVTVYSLTEEELSALREQYLQEQREQLRRQELLAHWNELKNELVETKGQLTEIIEDIADGNGWLNEGEFTERVKNCQQNLNKLLDELDDCLMPGDNDILEEALLKIKAEQEHIRAKIPALQDESFRLRKQLEKVLDEEIAGLFEVGERVENKQREETHTEFMKQSIAKLLDLQANSCLPPSCRRAVDQAITRMKMANANHQLKSFCTIELPKVISSCEKFLDEWEAYGEEYQKLCLEYRLAKERNGEQESMEMVAFGREAIPKLKSLIHEEEEQALAEAQKSYVEQAIGEVMQEMGYDVLGMRDVTKRNGKHFVSRLFSYGADTAINVTYADDGQISMEMGKIDLVDRIPTDMETNYLENQMLHFCDKFKDMEKRLADKGVLVGKRIALSPPTADYAQIINTQDYKIAVSEKEHRERKIVSARNLRVDE